MCVVTIDTRLRCACWDRGFPRFKCGGGGGAQEAQEGGNPYPNMHIEGKSD